ncbi:hypothetical protein A6770_15295 [Nostoc minutum NIES-26]|uniref:Low-complexity protein n=1 Tax=Nostoc minutum NIES-26 TaxID=1844469 RepID=A0A367RKA5_9NOSO|nr:hypothetical protein A6770_15295 [Nostoc minutum NIES-26]
MSDNNTDTLKNWLIGLAVIFLLFIAGVFLAFLNFEDLSTEQRFKYGTPALTTTGVIFAGFAGIINAYYAAKRAEAMDKSALAANESAKAALENARVALKNAEIAEDKQITERFAKAIEQLGSDKIEVRLGAIYTLERIAKDSPKDHWTIMEILTAFVRENAPLKAENTKPLIHNWLNDKTAEAQQNPKICTDIQAALTVIGRREFENDPENQRLDLRNIDIKGANLFQANLQKAIFTGSNLQMADLNEAKLQESDLHGAYLVDASLRVAQLQGAKLNRANLQRADLGGAYLQKAFLCGANLQWTSFYKTNLQGTEFDGATNLEPLQIALAICDRDTSLPPNILASAHWKKFIDTE